MTQCANKKLKTFLFNITIMPILLLVPIGIYLILVGIVAQQITIWYYGDLTGLCPVDLIDAGLVYGIAWPMVIMGVLMLIGFVIEAIIITYHRYKYAPKCNLFEQCS